MKASRIANPYGEFLGAFEHLLSEIEHEVLFTNVETAAKLVASVRRMLMRQVDGVVLTASEFDTKAIEPLLFHRVPLVTVDRSKVQRGSSDVAHRFHRTHTSTTYMSRASTTLAHICLPKL
jgi:DNA-binding LacI/PurR family transcriptional regulator